MGVPGLPHLPQANTHVGVFEKRSGWPQETKSTPHPAGVGALAVAVTSALWWSYFACARSALDRALASGFAFTVGDMAVLRRGTGQLPLARVMLTAAKCYRPGRCVWRLAGTQQS